MARNQLTPLSFALLVALGCSSSSNQTAAGSGGNANGGSTSCQPGAETCACYGNGTCNPGLECRSNLCVSASPGNGGSSAGSNANGGTSASGGSTTGVGGALTGGTPASGGVLNTGGTNATGGSATAAVGGNNPTGGASATGGAKPTGGSTGTGGTTGATCSNTSTDWQNCGTCGHACKNQGQRCGSNCCVGGQCAPFWGPCITTANGFANCSQACASIGTTCAANGCYPAGSSVPLYTWLGWGTIGGAADCANNVGPAGTSGTACDSALPWTASSEIVRCCCAEP